MDLAARAAGIGALADRTRRALYEYVCAQPGPVGRERAAEELGIAAHKAKFHLDKLVDEGLLEVEYRRLTGRVGPGAGRPSKLYRRAAREISVSLPPRRYDLIGDILAAGVARAQAGDDLEGAMLASARDEGASVGRSAHPGRPTEPAELAEALGSQGYEPHLGEDVLELSNCPFDSLADKHTELVCSLNRDYVQGVAEGMDCQRADARLEPQSGRCCVRVHMAP